MKKVRAPRVRANSTSAGLRGNIGRGGDGRCHRERGKDSRCHRGRGGEYRNPGRNPNSQRGRKYVGSEFDSQHPGRKRRRRTKPVLYRHRATCRSHVWFFDGIDDSVYLAKLGVVWSIPIRGRESLLEVIAVACLGYREDDAKKKNKSHKSKSAKVNDTLSPSN